MAEKKDNSDPRIKAALRTRYLPDGARVLDLFCGDGEMYRRCYAGRVAEYRGVDRKKVHDSALCDLDDNRRWVRTHDLSRFDVFDLDAYGSTFEIYALVMRKARAERVSFFITDGSQVKMRLDQRMARLFCATEGFPAQTKIHGISRFYSQIFMTAAVKIAARNSYGIDRSYVATTGVRGSINYWFLQLSKT